MVAPKLTCENSRLKDAQRNNRRHEESQPKNYEQNANINKDIEYPKTKQNEILDLKITEILKDSLEEFKGRSEQAKERINDLKIGKLKLLSLRTRKKKV